MKFISSHKKTAKIWLLVLSPLFSLPSLSLAQSSTPDSASSSGESFHIRPWAVGQSATYQTKTFTNGRLVMTGTTTYSIVGLEVIDGKNYLWLEIEREGPGSVNMVHKLQIQQPKEIDFENVLVLGLDSSAVVNPLLIPRRRIEQITLPGAMKRSSVHEFEIKAEAVSQAENGEATSAIKDFGGFFSVTANQTVLVPAGSFKAAEFRRSKEKSPVSSIDAYGNPELPIWGLVKKTVQSKDSKQEFLQQTELVSYRETGAVSKIKGKPRLVSLAEQDKMKKESLQKSVRQERGNDAN